MKLTIAILFCVISTLQYDGANGERKNLFERIQGSVNNVKQDLNNLLHPNVKKQQEQESSIHFVEDESEEIDFAAAAAARRPVETTLAPTTSTTTLAPTTSTTTLAPTPTTATIVAPTANTATTLAPTTTTATNGNTTTTEKARENFKGGCLPGYMRTADGRCKPTF